MVEGTNKNAPLAKLAYYKMLLTKGYCAKILNNNLNKTVINKNYMQTIKALFTSVGIQTKSVVASSSSESMYVKNVDKPLLSWKSVLKIDFSNC